jgi:SNF2 family DNA or RNA helicase
MGLGKTIQVAITLQYFYQVVGLRGPFLVVGPLSIIENWKRELEKWTDLNCVIFHGTAQARNLIKKREFYFDGDPKDKNGDIVHKFNVIITTEEMVKTDSTLKGVHWQYLAIDEGHRMKVKRSFLMCFLM